MTHQFISLREANQNFSRVIAAVERGEAFAITRRGQEIARLSPSRPVEPALPGGSKAESKSFVNAALDERMRRLEVVVDKLLSALAAPDKK